MIIVMVDYVMGLVTKEEKGMKSIEGKKR